MVRKHKVPSAEQENKGRERGREEAIIRKGKGEREGKEKKKKKMKRK